MRPCWSAKQLSQAEESLAHANGSTMIHNEVNEEHVAQVVSRTGVPVSRLMSGQRTADENGTEISPRSRPARAVSAICNAVRTVGRTGRSEPPDWGIPVPWPYRRGKTELAKAPEFL